MWFFFAFIVTIYKQKCEIMITDFFKNLWNKLFPKKVQTIETPATWTPSMELQAYIQSSTKPTATIVEPEPIVVIEPESPTIEISDNTVIEDSFEAHENIEPVVVIPTKKRAYTKRAPAKKAVVKRAPIKKAPAKKTVTKKVVTKKAPVKKVAIKKVAPKKVATKKITKNKK